MPETPKTDPYMRTTIRRQFPTKERFNPIKLTKFFSRHYTRLLFAIPFKSEDNDDLVSDVTCFRH